MGNLKGSLAKVYQNPTVRAITIILAAVLAFGLIGVIVDSVNPPDEVRDAPVMILFADCDDDLGWQEVQFGGQGMTFNRTYFTQGIGSLGCKIDGGTSRIFLLHYLSYNAVDISDMTHLVFDIYVENASKFNGKTYTAEIGSTSKCDTNEIQAGGLKFSGLSDGWNTVEVELYKMADQGNAASGTAFDPTNTCRMRLYTGEGAYSGLLLFDNIRFVRK